MAQGAVDADGKSGDGAGIKLEIYDFLKKKFLSVIHDDTREYVLEWFLCPKRF